MGLEKDGSAVQNTGYSSKRTRFNSQHPYSGSQPSVTPVSADPNSFSGLHTSTRHELGTQTDAGSTHTHIK